MHTPIRIHPYIQYFANTNSDILHTHWLTNYSILFFQGEALTLNQNRLLVLLGYYSSSCGYCKSKPRKTRQILSISSRLFYPRLAVWPLHLPYFSNFSLKFWLTWHCGWWTQGKTDWLILFPFEPPFRLCDWYDCIVFTAIALSNLSRYWLASVRIDALPQFYHDLFQLGWKIGLRDNSPLPSSDPDPSSTSRMAIIHVVHITQSGNMKMIRFTQSCLLC